MMIIIHWQNNITCSTNCKYRTAATHYTLETFFLRCIIVGTLHKGDNKDDDDDDNNNNNNNNNFIIIIITTPNTSFWGQYQCLASGYRCI